jgi:hypothetical protein
MPGGVEGLEQGAYAAPSRLQAKVDVSEAPKAKVAVVWVVLAGGPDEIVVVGATVSIVKELAALDPTFPAASLCAACAV